MKTLHDLFLNELADIYDAEKRSFPMVDELERAAAGIQLRRALRAHMRRRAKHPARIEAIFSEFGVSARSRTCEATTGLFREIHEILGEFRGSPAIDAAVISAAQKIGHYSIVTYGCLMTWAGKLGSLEAAHILDGMLEEERAFDAQLSLLARHRSNQRALGENVLKGAPRRGEPVRLGRKRS